MDTKEYVTSEIRCPVPWTGIMVNHDGQVKNCIRAYEDIGDLKTTPIRDIVLGSKNTEIQQAHQSNNKHTSCQGCHKLEEQKTDFNIVSDRKYYIKELRNVDRGIYDHNIHELHQIDVRWQNTCNFTCIYCGPEFSSKWAQELKVKQEVEKENVEKVKQYIFKNIKKLKNVYLAGGEPLLMNQNKEFLTLLLEHNPDVHLRVNTNLSSTKTGVFQLLCKFKNVHWTVSVDSMGKEYEYIRHHGSWEEFLKNLKHIQTLDHKVSFNMLFFILNYKSVFDCVDYLKSIGFHDNSFIIGPLYGPEYLNIRHLPDNIKQEVVDILEERIGKNTGFYLQNSLENCLKYLTQSNFHANIDTVRHSIQKLDKRRNLNSREIFPKLYREVLQ